MSQAGIISSGSTSSGVNTITGNDGVPESPIAGNFNFLTANSTVKFAGTAGTETLNFSSSNLILGSAGSTITSGLANTGLGSIVLAAVTSGMGNTCFGFASGNKITNGGNNCFFGNECGFDAVSTSNNCGFGSLALQGLSTGTGGNIALGNNALNFLTTGSSNIAIGSSAGGNYSSSESGNIAIGNTGTSAESNVTRIGTSQTRCFLAGITGVTVSNQQFVTINSATGQLGSVASASSSSTDFSVALTTATSPLSSGALSTVVYDTTLIDTALGYSAGVYTVPAGGTGNWLLTTAYTFSTSTSFTACDLFINKNNGTFLLHLLPSTPSDGVTINNGSGSGIFPLVAGDTLRISVDGITTGGNTFVGLGVSNGFFNIFSGYKLP